MPWLATLCPCVPGTRYSFSSHLREYAGPRSFLPSLHSRGSLFTCFCIISPPASQMQALCDQGGLSYVPSTYSRARYSAVACVIFTEFTNGRGTLGDKFSLGRHPRCSDCSVSVTAIVLVPSLLLAADKQGFSRRPRCGTRSRSIGGPTLSYQNLTDGDSEAFLQNTPQTVSLHI